MSPPDIGAQLRKGVVEYCVLGLLQQEKGYGWKISEQLVESGLIGSIGTLYPVMARLRARGLISVGTDASDRESARRYYTLTASGRRELRHFRDQWQIFTNAVDSVVAPTSGTASDPSASEPRSTRGNRPAKAPATTEGELR